MLHGERRYGFFFPVSEDEPAGSSGEVVLLEVTELDEDGQPSAFELVEDEGVASEAVSYTHLDVYKRQEYIAAQMAYSDEGPTGMV